MPTNLILATDSYKHSHFRQYPPEAARISAYIEARPNDFSDDLLFLGLQPFLDDYLARPITRENILEAHALCMNHGVPFNLAGWERILDAHGGYLPIAIEALPEGMVVPTGTPLVQVVNTDPRMPWLATFIETALLRAIWYPTTVGTLSMLCKRAILDGLSRTSDDPAAQIPFKLHDFGARGVSSGESAGLGGMAHLVNFAGTDTLEGILAARHYYGPDDIMPGFSIPAAEHSTMTSWGRTREAAAYANMLEQFPGLVAVVSDSYDLDVAVGEIWGRLLRDAVLAHEGTLVVRPDSGDPVLTPIRVLETLWARFGGTINGKGYRVLDPHVRVIQGDGMNLASIKHLVAGVAGAGFAIDNIAFGMGGGLLQGITRDTLRFAMKANAMEDKDGTWHDVRKVPKTDPGKASKAGRQAVVATEAGFETVPLSDLDGRKNLLRPVWKDGQQIGPRQTFEELRAQAAEGL